MVRQVPGGWREPRAASAPSSLFAVSFTLDLRGERLGACRRLLLRQFSEHPLTC